VVSMGVLQPDASAHERNTGLLNLRSRDLMTLNPAGHRCVARAEQCRGRANPLTTDGH
jgi:hypothetical protein